MRGDCRKSTADANVQTVNPNERTRLCVATRTDASSSMIEMTGSLGKMVYPSLGNREPIVDVPFADDGTSIGSSQHGRAFHAISDQDRAYSAVRVDRDRKSPSSMCAKSRSSLPDGPPRRRR